jgi:tetratricopeptide (TPR) repeat protein
VLSQAAVIGRDFDLGVLAPVAALDEDELLDVIDESVTAGLLIEVEGLVDRFSFSHALTQHTLYDDLGASRRARIHRRVAQVLEELYRDAPESRAAELARHFVAATRSVDVMKALTYSKQAGDDALAQSAPADAVGFFVQALDLYSHIDPDAGMHCDLLIGLGAAQCRSGDPAHRQTLLDAAAIARTLDDTARLVAAALANRGGVSHAGNVDQERVKALEHALGSLATSDSPERALLLATLSAELSYIDERERLVELSSAALGMARRLDDPMTLLRVTSLVYHGYVIPDNLQQRLEDLRDALAIASMNVDPAVALHLHNSRAIACLQAGDGEGFDRHVEQCNVMAERVDQPFERWTALVLLCNQSLVRGDAASAETHANEALAVGTDTVPEALTTFGVQLIEIRRLQGRLQELSGMCEVIAQTAVENPGLPVLQVVLARMYCDLGRKEDARTTAAEQIALGSSHLPHDYAWLPGLCVLSAVLVDLELLDGARAVYRRMLPWGDQVASVGVTTEGPVAAALGSLAALIGDFQSAEAHFLKALEMCDGLRAPYWSLRSRLGLADMLARRGGPTDSSTRTAVLNAAEADAARHGLMHLFDATGT